jgi:hypothetical protein
MAFARLSFATVFVLLALSRSAEAQVGPNPRLARAPAI